MSSNTPHRPGRLVSLGQPVKLEPSLKDMPPTAAELSAQQTLAMAQDLSDQLQKDASDKARELVRQAHLQAEQIELKVQAQGNEKLAQLETELEEQRELARQSGYEAGVEQALQDCQALIDSATQIANGAYEQQRKVLQHLSRQAVVLMQAALGKVLGEQWAINMEDMVALAYDQAVESLHLSGRMTLVVHPVHLQRLRDSEVLPLDGDALSGTTRLRLTGDPMLAENELFLTSEEGQYDLTIERAAQHLVDVEVS